MQPAGGMIPSPMAPPPQQIATQSQQQPQQWGMIAPPPPPPQTQQQQYQQQTAPLPPMWNQQPSQIPPPQPLQVPPPQPQSAPVPMPQYQAAMPPPPPTTAVAPRPTSADEIRTLWIGDLLYWMDESYIHSCFASTGELVSVKVIRNKQTAQSEGYGFIEFATRATAESVLQAFNGQMMPSVEQRYRLNWAYLGAGEKKDDGADHTIFVGDLAADVTDYMLQETFRVQYPSVKGAKVVTDRTTGRSKGYGFVRFGDATEQARAMTEMNGMFCSTRAMRIGPAINKKNLGSETKVSLQSTQATQETDPSNTTVFVGGLDSTVTDDHLRQVFGQYGELVHVKIPVGKRCGFVQFAKRACAEEAILMLQGAQLGGQSIRLSWGRSPSSKQDTPGWTQPQQDPSQWSSGYYGYGQGYEQYAYAQPAQDPNMYAYGAYPGYGSYQQQQ